MEAHGLDAIKAYARKHVERKDLEERAEKLKAECAGLLPAVLRYFEQNAVDRQSIEGYTVAPRYELWASRNSEKSQGEMHDALIEAGLPEYATESMNHQSMSAYIREMYRELVAEENEKPTAEQRLIGMPELYEEIFARHPELNGILEVREDLKISVTKSKKSRARSRIKDVLDKKDAMPAELAGDEIL